MKDFATNIGAIAGVLLVFTWAGYPILAELIARFIRPKPPTATRPQFPKVSIVVATRGPLDLVERRIRNLRETSYPSDRYEIVIGIDASVAGALDGLAAERAGSVSVVKAGGAPGKPNALNSAVKVCTGEILIFADSAQLFEPEAIPELVKCFDDPRIGAVSGQLDLSPALSRRLVGWYWRMERRLRANEARIHSSVGVTGAIYAMRRELFRPLPEDILLDDLYTPMQVVLRGFRIGFTDKARATDVREPTVTSERRRKERTLAGVIQLCSQLPGVLNPARNPIWIQFVVHKLMRFASPILLLASLPALWLAFAELNAALPGSLGAALWVIVVGALALVLVVPRTRSMVREFFGMNWVVLRALHRGMRRDWDFW